MTQIARNKKYMSVKRLSYLFQSMAEHFVRRNEIHRKQEVKQKLHQRRPQTVQANSARTCDLMELYF